MEFLRFGSSIPGGYWGCCACDIIQNFKVDPDAKASIQLVEGDGGTTLGKFVGMTYREIFEQRLRFGTFSMSPMPNHAFIAILSKSQTDTALGKKWLAILKANGFEFIRAVNNSVWNVDNYIFALIRNCGPNAVKDQFKPPKAWTDLPSVVPEPSLLLATPAEEWGGGVELTASIKTKQSALYNALPPAKFYTEAQVEAAGIPVTYAGKRSKFPQQLKSARQSAEAAEAKVKTPTPSAFPAKAPMPKPTAG